MNGTEGSLVRKAPPLAGGSLFTFHVRAEARWLGALRKWAISSAVNVSPVNHISYDVSAEEAKAVADAFARAAELAAELEGELRAELAAAPAFAKEPPQ